MKNSYLAKLHERRLPIEFYVFVHTVKRIAQAIVCCRKIKLDKENYSTTTKINDMDDLLAKMEHVQLIVYDK